MDDRAIGGEELREALRQLRTINRWLGAAAPTVEGVHRLWHRARRPARLHLLDVGAGSGDQSRALLRWADQQGVALTITLLDIHPETCAEAADCFAGELRVTVQQGDLFSLPAASADIVTASLVLHHFGAVDLPRALAALRRAANVGVVINDLHRHWLAWATIALATRTLSQNRMIRHDAPLSVRRGFRREELERLRALPELAGLELRWRPFFRYLALLPAGGEHRHA